MAATAATTTGISGEPTASADVAATIAFLVSDDASFVSGQVLYVAGGPPRLSARAPGRRSGARRPLISSAVYRARTA
jgi:enoyl-[acyl-carrier-protein] reductase (NADH)